MTRITVKESIEISATREVVWDYTQDYSKRMKWDRSVLKATVLNDNPRHVRIEGRGGLKTELLYKLDDRPNKTTLVMINTSSSMIEGGGGSWEYIADETGTNWTQTNTLVLKKSLVAKLMKPLIEWILKMNTRKAMQLAKGIIEGNQLPA